MSENLVVVSTGPSGFVTNTHAWAALSANPNAPLDAVQTGLVAAENDPELDDIGYGGMPDANGVMSLDAALMDGASHRAGAVAALLGCKNPVAVARRVMDKTPHVFLVGAGARAFADAEGFANEGALLTPASEAAYAAYLQGDKAPTWTGESPPPPSPPSPAFPEGHDTVGCAALGAGGNLAGGCSTSGLNFKMPGRVGDSPIIGSGLYVDNNVGAATCFGMGEQMMQIGLSLRIVLAMERGLSPKEACEEGIRHLLAKRPGVENMRCCAIALAKSGETGGAATTENDFYFYRTDAQNGTVKVDVDKVQ